MFQCARRSSLVLLIEAQCGALLSASRLLFLGVGRVGLPRQIIDYPRHTLIDGTAQGAPMRASRCLNVFEGDYFTRMFITDRTTEEVIVVEHSDFGQVARVIADGDRIADIGSQGRMVVTEPLEMNAVTPHGARFG